jgi:hypothetical protein
MISAWWLLWIAGMIVLLAPPVGYGWGYRGWGAPYPRYIQRRRGQAAGEYQNFNHESWGWGGDFVWTILLFGTFWAFLHLWWP